MTNFKAESGGDSRIAGDSADRSLAPEDQVDDPSHSKRTPPLLVVIEGRNDIEFLRRISAMLSASDNRLPDLSILERRGKIVFVPFGGGDIQSWVFRLAPLCKSEVHVYDREIAPVSELRHRAAQIVNLRPGCRAFVTDKRSVENYLHPQAIFEASGIQIEVGDNDDVADLVAQKRFLTHDRDRDWLSITARCRRRLRNRAKLWLNRDGAGRMTAELLAARDPDGEVRNWLTTIAEMVADLS